MIPASDNVLQVVGVFLNETRTSHSSKVKEWSEVRESLLGMVVSGLEKQL